MKKSVCGFADFFKKNCATIVVDLVLVLFITRKVMCIAEDC